MVRPCPRNPDAFEDHVKDLLENNYGCEVIKPPKNQPDYDLEITKQDSTNISEDKRSAAVQIKNFKKRVSITSVRKFISFLMKYQAQIQFSEGLFISSNGFSKPAIDYVRNESKENPRAPVVCLGTANTDDIEQDFHDPRSSLSLKRERDSLSASPLVNYQNNIYEENNTHKIKSRRYYFGIFTNKGGTGKTTVAAHLAGAFALIGYDVILLDLDPQRNLKKLFQNDEDDSSLYVPPLRPGQTGRGIFVLNDREWEDDKSEYNDIEIVICDCNPTLEENPSSLVKEFDYCIVPTTLNPLGIAKNGDVIQRTFERIRLENSKAQMHVLINCYNENKATQKRNKLLLGLLKEKVDLDEDKKFYLIDPNICAIHHSISLYYWGMHVVENKEPQLAFELFGGKSVPGDDFLKLADYFRGRLEEPQ